MLTELKAARMRKGLKQKEVAEITGINRTSVSSFEQRRLVATAQQRQAIVDLLGGKESDFFESSGLAL